MIEDLREFHPDTGLEVDLCVVGAGPAGITIAKEFLGSGIRVCLVESGGFQEEADTQALYRGESVGHPMALDEGRYRVFGGSATHWGGRTTTLDPIDFEARDWVQHSGWPISLSHLRPYYERAKAVNNYKAPWIPDRDVPAAAGIDLPPFRSSDIVPFVWRYAAPDLKPTLGTYLTLGYGLAFNWGTAYRARLKESRDTTVLLHANLTALISKADGSAVEAITVTSLTKHSLTIKAKVFVLCCSGVENARLLLDAPEQMARRMSGRDNLGLYFAQHPRGCVGTLSTDNATAARLQKTFAVLFRPRSAPIRYELGFALSEHAQRTYKLLNASAALYFEAGPTSPWKAAKRLRDSLLKPPRAKQTFRDIATVTSGAASIAQNLVRRFVLGRPIIVPDPVIKIVIDLEQQPDPASRITLSDERDALGLRQAKVDWRISNLERKTARYFANFLCDELEQLGLGETTLADWVTSEAPLGPTDLQGNYHFIGATRMAPDPRDGVVDTDCRVHGLDNLYVAGCSVFPTGGHGNPTLTIVALAIRLADHLRAKLAVGA
jgi:choline dehydrogenase-like flavoprotein